MADVVTQGQDFAQIVVQAESGGDGASDLADLQGVGQPVPEVIGIVGIEDLGLLVQTAKRLGVNDAVPVPLERVAIGVLRLRVAPPLAVFDFHREGCQGRHAGDYRRWAEEQGGRLGRLSQGRPLSVRFQEIHYASG